LGGRHRPRRRPTGGTPHASPPCWWLDALGALGGASSGGGVRRRAPMTYALPRALEQQWQEILRRTAFALNGRSVGVWEADAGGRPQLVVASSAEDIAPLAAELEVVLRAVSAQLPAAGRTVRRWVASRLEPERWCIAPVRSEPPQPPPAGVERRGQERLLLELAGVCIGLIERRLAEQPLPFKAVAELAEEKLVHQALHDALTDLPN